MNKTIGLILLALSMLGLGWGGFAYTTREKIVDIEPSHFNSDQSHTVPLPPIAGTVALIGGIVLLVTGRPE